MMKYILLFALLLPAAAFCQKDSGFFFLPKDESGHVTYERIVTVDGVSKDSLYNRAKSYIASIVQGPLTVDDRQAGLITVVGNIKTIQTNLLMKFFVKDNKVKVVLTNLAFNYTEPKSYESMESDMYATYLKRQSRNKKTDPSGMQSFHVYLVAFLDSIEKELKKKSDFDF